jgi:recombination protein RecA
MARKQTVETIAYPTGTKSEAKSLIEAMKKQFPDARVFGVAAQVVNHSEPIPTGSVTLDWALGTRGLMPNKIYEIYGPPSSGKSLLVYQIIRQVQQTGKLVVYFDTERSVDETVTLAWMAKQGVDVDNLIYGRDTAEMAMNLACRCAEDERVGLIVIDSIATLELERVVEKDEIGEQKVKSIANLMKPFTSKFNVVTQGAALICINQVRAAMGYSAPGAQVYETTGGWAWKHNCQVRIEVKGIKLWDGDGDKKELVGLAIRTRMIKNKLASNGKTGEMLYYFGQGIDRADELTKLGLKHQCISRAGAWLSFTHDGRELRAQGTDRFVTEIRNHPDVQDALYEMIMQRRTATIEVAPEELDNE